MDRSPPDESCLIRRHQLRHERGEHDCQDLGDKLAKTVHHGYGPEVGWAARTSSLGQQDDESIVQASEASSVASMESLQSKEDVLFDDSLARFVECACEPIRPRRTVRL